MKIAVTYENGQVFQHFGHTEQFKIYTVDDENILSSEIVNTDGTGHGALADFLKERGVNVLICGGIGAGAVMARCPAAPPCPPSCATSGSPMPCATRASSSLEAQPAARTTRYSLSWAEICISALRPTAAIMRAGSAMEISAPAEGTAIKQCAAAAGG